MRDCGAELWHHSCQKLVCTLHNVQAAQNKIDREEVPVQDAPPTCEMQDFQIVEASVVVEPRRSTYLTRRVS